MYSLLFCGKGFRIPCKNVDVFEITNEAKMNILQ